MSNRPGFSETTFAAQERGRRGQGGRERERGRALSKHEQRGCGVVGGGWLVLSRRASLLLRKRAAMTAGAAAAAVAVAKAIAMAAVTRLQWLVVVPVARVAETTARVEEDKLLGARRGASDLI